jgi:hypothetical protein
VRLALFNGHRLGVVRGEPALEIVDVTAALPAWDDGYAANWWLRLCHDFVWLRPRIEEVTGDAASGNGERLAAPTGTGRIVTGDQVTMEIERIGRVRVIVR